ncbi:YihY/virulence factor BrkB family protein [Anoxynatronum buryatiense]|uniref:Membrane protein n=1 Tax=Anoxynatronum buryatiense TaxID=489973 RepID=A0AA46AJU8_9CLOT|nr:YihY/virulence factor BrkB family protein [Anoxynatronum buryatiense]SMP64968.1 membrane protein [Anoxynatronum buryatiense]
MKGFRLQDLNLLKHPKVKALRLLGNRIQENELTALAAQSTYYLVLSFFPFLIFLITLISYTPLLQEEVLYQLQPFLPQEAFELVMRNVQQMMDMPRGTLMSTGMITTVFLASNGVAALLRGINKAFRNQEKRPFWKVRGMALIFTLVLAFTILLSLLMLVFGQLIGTYLFELLGISQLFRKTWQWARIAASLAVMILVFTLFYTFSPQQRIKLRESFPGAVFTTIGWLVLSYGFAHYVNTFGNYSVTYGSIGGIIVLLTWLYLSSIVILLGGEINAWRLRDKLEKKASGS